MKIGWSAKDVSTNEPVTITGQAYERISTGSFDPTTITVLYLEDGGDCVFFLSGDFTNFSGDLLVELKEKVAKEIPAVDPRKIVMNATHTHTAPRYFSSTGYDLAPKDRVTIYPWQKYRAFLLENMCAAIREAYEGRKEGFLAYGLSSAEVSVQRRCVYSTDHGVNNTIGNTFAVNGYGMMYGKTDLPDFLGFESGLESTVNLLFTFDEEKKLTGAIVNLPCPSQCTEHEAFTSADFWNEAREEIRKEHGNIFILPQCAAAGDLSPHRLINKESLLRRNRLKFGDDPKAEKFSRPLEYYNRKVLGERIAHAFSEGLSWAKNELISSAPIVHRVESIPLKAWRITPEEYETSKKNQEEVRKTPFQCTDDPIADYTANTKISANINRYNRIIKIYEEGTEFFDTEIHVLSIGDVAFASNPFELYLDYQHRIQGRSPFVQTFIVQLSPSSTAVGGYLPTEKAVKNKGYSAISFSCSVNPEGGATLVEKTLELLEEIHS